MSDAIAKTNLQVGANTGPAVTEFDKLLRQLKATERQVKALQDAGKSDALIDATKDIVTSAKVLPRTFADATREVQKLIAATRQRNAAEKEGMAARRASADLRSFTASPARRAAMQAGRDPLTIPSGGPGTLDYHGSRKQMRADMAAAAALRGRPTDFTSQVAAQARGGGLGFGAVAGLSMKAIDLALSAATAPLDFVKESVGRAADAEKTAAAFDVLTGSAAKATQVLAGLRAYAADSPLGTASILDAARNLSAVGVEADQLVPTMRMLGDIAGGDAERLRGVSKAYGDVLTSGRLAGQELIQFSNAGVPLLDELAKQAG